MWFRNELSSLAEVSLYKKNWYDLCHSYAEGAIFFCKFRRRQAGKWLRKKEKSFLTYSTGFVYLTFELRRLKENIILDIKCSRNVFLCVSLQRDFVVVNTERMKREIPVSPVVQCQLLLSDFNKKWNRLTKFS